MVKEMIRCFKLKTKTTDKTEILKEIGKIKIQTLATWCELNGRKKSRATKGELIKYVKKTIEANIDAQYGEESEKQ